MVYLSANGFIFNDHLFSSTFLSDGNTVTFQFTTDISESDEGILMIYYLGK